MRRPNAHAVSRDHVTARSRTAELLRSISVSVTTTEERIVSRELIERLTQSMPARNSRTDTKRNLLTCTLRRRQ